MKIETYDDSKKQDELLRLLKFGTVMIFIDSRQKEVLVPEHLKGDFQLRLNFDYSYEIDDFQILPDRLEASLSFNKKNFFCVIPFGAVYLVLNNFIKQGSLFVESIPIEMLTTFADISQKIMEEPKKPSPFKVISPGEPNDKDKIDPPPTSTENPKKKRPELRVIK